MYQKAALFSRTSGQMFDLLGVFEGRTTKNLIWMLEIVSYMTQGDPILTEQIMSIGSQLIP